MSMYRSWTPGQPSPTDEEAAIGLLQYMDKDQLQSLLDNDDKVQDMLNDQPKVRRVQEEKESLMASNKSLGEYIMSKEATLAALKSQLALTYMSANDANAEFQQSKSQLDQKPQAQSVDTSLALLQTAAAEAEEESENVVEEFLQGSLSVEEFKQKFVSLKTQAHSRRVKVEKMQEQMSTGNHLTQQPPNNHYMSHYSQKSSANSYPPAPSLPYPAPMAAYGGAPVSYGMPDPSFYNRP